MKLNKKILVTMIVSIMAFSAVGCGKTDTQGNSNNLDRSGEGGKPIKMTKEEIDKALESGLIQPDN